MSAAAVVDRPAEVATAPVPTSMGRGTELGLLVIAVALGLIAYATTGLKLTGELPPGFWAQTIFFAVLALAIHAVVRWRAPYADPIILPIVVALNGIGLAMIYRYDLGTSLVKDQPLGLAPRQLQWTVGGVLVACAVLVFLRDHRVLRRFTYTFGVIGLVLVITPLLPVIGTEINGARIWVTIGKLSIQPGEFAKIAFAIFFAGYLVTRADNLSLAGPKFLGLRLPRLRDLGPIVIVWAASIAVLIFESDLGTSLLYFGLFVAMIYLATARTSWIVLGMAMFGAGVVVVATTIPHVTARFDGWLHALDQSVYDKKPGGSWQLVQGQFSMANGGLFGTGFGAGYPRLVQYGYSDFIYATLGEQIGLAGLMAILLLYLVLAERGIRAAISARDGFGKLLAGGLAFVIGWQVFVVVGGITRVIPLTGLTLPFMAHGGSSLLANWLVAALLLRVSNDARRPSAPTERGQVVAGRVIADDGARRGAEPDDARTELLAAGAEYGAQPAGDGYGIQPAGDDLATQAIAEEDAAQFIAAEYGVPPATAEQAAVEPAPPPPPGPEEGGDR